MKRYFLITLALVASVLMLSACDVPSGSGSTGKSQVQREFTQQEKDLVAIQNCKINTECASHFGLFFRMSAERDAKVEALRVKAQAIIDDKNALDREVQLASAKVLAEKRALQERYAGDVAWYQACNIAGIDLCFFKDNTIGKQAYKAGFSSMGSNKEPFVYLSIIMILITATAFSHLVWYEKYQSEKGKKIQESFDKKRERLNTELSAMDKKLSLKKIELEEASRKLDKRIESEGQEVGAQLKELKTEAYFLEGYLERLVDGISETESSLYEKEADFKTLAQAYKRIQETKERDGEDEETNHNRLLIIKELKQIGARLKSSNDSERLKASDVIEMIKRSDDLLNKASKDINQDDNHEEGLRNVLKKYGFNPKW